MILSSKVYSLTMSAKTYMNLLVLYNVLCQGILGTLSENDIGELSDLLVRQKRVINSVPGGDRREMIRDFPYVVSIRPFRTTLHCVGAILTAHIVLTAAACVKIDVQNYYRIYSGNARTSSGKQGTHSIVEKKILLGKHQNRPNDGIALLAVSPSFTYSLTTRHIELYEGNIHPGTYGTVSGWGCNTEGDPGTKHPTFLRSITVPMISNHQCSASYENHVMITENDICTLDPHGLQRCVTHDTGAPLVVKENDVPYLVGIYLWKGNVLDKHNPEVYANLRTPIYKVWITETIRSLEADLH